MSKANSRQNKMPQMEGPFPHAMCDQTKACRALWAAVFLNAIADLAGASATFENGRMRVDSKLGQALRQEAKQRAIEWVRSTDLAPCGFEWVCNQLDLDPDIVRPRLLAGEFSLVAAGHWHRSGAERRAQHFESQRATAH